ncbi:MAG: hypothetical protein KBF32_09070 [Chitinophagales bacterium]|nr:hypothetical protein [Chitinophagales bacterium]
MKNKELKQILNGYPDEMEVNLYTRNGKLIPFDDENICDHADDDRISERTGNLVKGKNKRVIVINPPIL